MSATYRNALLLLGHKNQETKWVRKISQRLENQLFRTSGHRSSLVASGRSGEVRFWSCRFDRPANHAASSPFHLSLLTNLSDIVLATSDHFSRLRAALAARWVRQSESRR